MKTTTTVYEILHSELHNNGKNEFFNDSQIDFFSDKNSFIKKIMRYDNDVHKIVTNKIFQELRLKNNESDKHFKQTFINKFLNRQIAYQTMEVFSSQVVYTFLSKELLLNQIYENLEDFLLGRNITESDDNGKRLSDFRQLNTTLPQDNINLNVDNTVLNYADDNTITRTRDNDTKKSNTENKSYSLDELEKLNNLINPIFDEFDRVCFLQIW